MSSSSDSASSSEAHTEGDDDGLEDGIALPPAFRITAKGKFHLQHFLLDIGIVSYCREAPFKETPEAVDEEDLHKANWNVCKNCLRALPPRLRRMLRSS